MLLEYVGTLHFAGCVVAVFSKAIRWKPGAECIGI